MAANRLAETLDLNPLDAAVGQNLDESVTPRWRIVLVAVGYGVTAVELDEFGQPLLAEGATTITLIELAGDSVAGYVNWDPDETNEYATWVETDLERIVDQLQDGALLDPDGPCDEWALYRDEGSKDETHTNVTTGFETAEGH